MNGKEEKSIDEIIEQSPSRPDIVDAIPHGSRRILDFGCGPGQVILQLKRDKACTELFAVDIKEECRELVEEHVDRFWTVDLGQQDAELGAEYEGFFDYVIMHDVVEHLYDPWYVLAKMRKYLAPHGELIMVVPNFRHWGFIFHLMLGRFPYGAPGGLMNEEHIRWFTLQGIEELLSLSGYEIVDNLRLFPPGIDLNILAERIHEPINHIDFPPAENQTSDDNKITVQFPEYTDIRKEYLHFLVHKYQVRCKADLGEVELEPITDGALERRRSAQSK